MEHKIHIAILQKNNNPEITGTLYKVVEIIAMKNNKQGSITSVITILHPTPSHQSVICNKLSRDKTSTVTIKLHLIHPHD